MKTFFHTDGLFLVKIVIALIVLSMSVTIYYWLRGLYRMHKILGAKEQLEYYVKSKYLWKSFLSALCTAILIIIFGLIWSNLYLFVLGMIWSCMVIFLLSQSKRWLVESLQELKRLNDDLSDIR